MGGGNLLVLALLNSDSILEGLCSLAKLCILADYHNVPLKWGMQTFQQLNGCENSLFFNLNLQLSHTDLGQTIG